MNRAHRWARFAAIPSLALLLTGLVAPVAAASSPTTRWVDADGHAGPSSCGQSHAAFTSIQAAVTASGPHDTVMVCPGTYTEQVRIGGNRAGLTLRGVKPWSVDLVAPSALADVGWGTYMVWIDHVKGVTVRGLRLDAPTAGACTPVEVAIYIDGSVNATVRGNEIFSGANPGKCGYFDGIILDNDAHAASAFVGYNLVQNFQHWGIAAGEGNDVTLTAVHNSMHYNLTAAAEPPSASSHRNTRWGSASPAGVMSDTDGIYLLGDVTATLTKNVTQSKSFQVVFGAGTVTPQLLDGGIFLDETGAGVVVNGNLARRSYVGIWISDADASTVSNNTIYQTGGGIVVQDTTNAHVTGNDTKGVFNGIWTDTNGTGNTFTGNTAKSQQSGGSDGGCVDESTGTGTANTANTWTGNTANSDSPAGICPAVPD